MDHTSIDIISMGALGCPTEWVIQTDDGRTLDVHYRFGELRVWQRPHDYDDRTTVWRAQVGDDHDGYMDDDTMLAHLAGAL